MKKVFLAVLVFVISSFAQLTYDVGLELGMPTGDYSDMAGIGIGVTVKGYYPIKEKINATGRIGYIHLTGDSEEIMGTEFSYSFYHIPIMAGIQYDFTPEFYGLAELGLTMFGYDFEAGTWSDSDSEMDIAISFGAGYRVNEKVNVAGYFNSVMAEGESFNMLMLRLGYNFK